MKKETVIISLGGSLVVPDAIDTAFLKNFRDLVLNEIQENKRFVVIVGGGKTCRRYQDAARKIARVTDEDLDWLGIHTTRLNAHLLRTMFRDVAHPIIITNPKKDALPKQASVIIAAGFRPGASTDLRAVELAERLGAKKMVNLSNISHVYDKDPKRYKHAKKIKEISWREFRKLLPNKWDPGLNAPFDPVAAHLAERLGMEVAIMGGLAPLRGYLTGKKYIGTIIRS